MMVQISAIIPTFNSVKTVEKAVESLLDQTLKLAEIIVVDNGSTDQTTQKLRRKFSGKINIVSLKENTGVTGGRNRGIKNLTKKNDLVLFFDHDMVAEKDLVKQLVAVSQTNKKIGIVTPKIFYKSQKKQIWSAGTGMNLLTGQVLFRGGLDRGQYEQIEEVQVAPAVMLVQKELLGKLKGFEDKYFATFEDTDFCFRARKIGYKTFYAPKALAYHDLPFGHLDESKRLVKRLYWVGRNRVLFMKDFGENYLIFLLFLPVFMVYYLRLSLKYGSIKNWLAFMQGTFDGLVNQ